MRFTSTAACRAPGLLAGALLVLVQVPAFAQDAAATARAGHDIALKLCAACHMVAPDQTAPPLLRPAAPSLETIANRATFSPERLQAFLVTTHRGVGDMFRMANPELTDTMARQVVAYMVSLRRAKAP